MEDSLSRRCAVAEMDMHGFRLHSGHEVRPEGKCNGLLNGERGTRRTRRCQRGSKRLIPVQRQSARLAASLLNGAGVQSNGQISRAKKKRRRRQKPAAPSQQTVHTDSSKYPETTGRSYFLVRTPASFSRAPAASVAQSIPPCGALSSAFSGVTSRTAACMVISALPGLQSLMQGSDLSA